MIQSNIQMTSRSETHQTFSNNVDIDELQSQLVKILSFKHGQVDYDEIQKFQTQVESKIYIAHEEIMALESEMKVLKDYNQSINSIFEEIKNEQLKTLNKLKEAEIGLTKIKNIFRRNQLLDLNQQEQIFENLKALKCKIYSKHSQILKQLLQEPIKLMEQFISENIYNQEQQDQQQNILNSPLTYEQQKRFSILNQFENYEIYFSVYHKDNIVAVQISPDEKFVATTGLDNILQLWNIDQRSKVADYYSNRQLQSLCFSKTSEFLYVGKDGELLKFKFLNSIKKNNQIQAHKKQIDYIMNIKDDIVITSSIDGTLKVIYFTQKPKILREIIHNNLEPRNFDYSEQYDFIVGSIGNKLVVWDQQNINQLMENDQCYQSNGVIQVQLSPGSNKVLSVSDKEPGIRLLHINFNNLQFALIQIVFTEIDQIWNISWGNDDDHFIFCDQQFIHKVQIHRLISKKIFQLYVSDRTILTNQPPSQRYFFYIARERVIFLEIYDDVLELSEGYLIQQMENLNIIQ